MNKAISQDTMKKENILSVLQCIQENGPIYRKDVKKITGLSGGSISSIVNRLLNAGLITERPYSVKTKGRNPGKLEDVYKRQILGQIAPGVPVWKLGEGSKYPGMPYIIFPGNVGDTYTCLLYTSRCV